MASQCVVSTCTWPENEADGERPSLHRFPWKQPQLARKWVANVIMSGTPAGKITHSSRVCSLHFEKGLRTSECIPTFFKGSKTDVEKFSANMALSNAERQRKYRLKRDRDPEKRQNYLDAEKKRYQADKVSGRTRTISRMTELEKYQQRRRWRERKREIRRNIKLAAARETWFKKDQHFFTDMCKSSPKSRKNKVKSNKTANLAKSEENSRAEEKQPVLWKQVVRNGFEKKFMSQLTDFWKFKRFCDLKLIFGDIEVLTHQLVFNVAQPSCLQGLRPIKGENSLLTVEVPIVASKEAVNSFMMYLYKGSLLITETTVYDILELGTFFNFLSIEYFCNSFIKAMTTYKKASMDELAKAGISPSIKVCKRYHSNNEPSETITMPTLTKESAYSDHEFDNEPPILSNFKIEIDVDEKDPVPEGVDETDMYTTQGEEDVSMETGDKPMRISCLDDNDQEWLLVPNDTEENSDTEREFDNEPDIDGDNADIPEIKKEQDEFQDDDGQLFMSPVNRSPETKEIDFSDGDKSGSHELDFDPSRDVKPILLPDGSILETNLAKEDSSCPMDKVDEREVAKAIQLIRKARKAFESEVDAAGEASGDCPQEPDDRQSQVVSPNILLDCDEDPAVLESEHEDEGTSSPDNSQDAFGLSNDSDHHTEEGSENKTVENAVRGEKVGPVVHSIIKDDSSVLVYEESDIGWESWESKVEPEVDFGVDEDGNPKPDYEEFKHNSIYFKYYKCDRCPSLFTSRVQRQQHVQVVHLGFRYVCQYCGKKMTSQNGLRTHELEHSEKQAYRCKKCNKPFQRKATLDMHIEKHNAREVINAATKEKVYNCRTCWASFNSGSSLAKHRSAAHKVIKCAKTVNQSPTRVSPLCPECDLPFKCVSSMRRHFKTEHPDLELPCSAQFNWKDVIQTKTQESMDKVHNETLERSPKPKRRKYEKPDHVTGTKNFHCQECGMDFLFAASLRRHSKSEHSNT